MNPAHRTASSGDRSIGAILIDSGKLTVEQAEQILRLQKEQGLRFGDAALKLGFIAAEDIQRALARQYDYPYLARGEGGISEELMAAYQPFSPQVEALRALRSQLMLRWFTGGEKGKALVVSSPGRGDGRSYLAANLAVVFSQLGEHTLLVDADMRHPRQHAIFGLDNRQGLSTMLSNRGDRDPIVRIESLMDLSILPAGPVPPNPQELLGRAAFQHFLETAASSYDIILIDTPASADFADGQTIASKAGGALLLARKHKGSLTDLETLGSGMRNLAVQVVGCVMTEH